MPYSGADDSSLPSYVKKLGDKDRRQWVSIFNSAFNSCMKKKKNTKSCESSAFAQANGVVIKGGKQKKSVIEVVQNMLTDFGNFLNVMWEEEDEPKEEAVSLDSVFGQAWKQASSNKQFTYPWPNNLYIDDNGDLSLIVSDSGKLYSTSVTVKGSDISIGDFVEVIETFTPVENNQRMTIVRQADNKVRWFLISGTSVLNRNGSIDSRKLFDNLKLRAEATGKYPYLTFFHQGANFDMGTADFLERSDNVAIASGLFDDNEVSKAMIAAYEKDPGYWGASNSYWPMGAPEMREVSESGVQIPVYEDGIYEEISILPEKDACSLFTAMISDTEVLRSMEKRLEDALRKLAGDDPALVDKFIKLVDDTNADIEKRGLITREAVKEQPAGDPPATTTQEPTDVQQEPYSAEPVVRESGELVLDDTMLQAVVSALLGNEQFQTLVAKSGNDVTAALTTLTQEMSQISAAVRSLPDLTHRVEALEKPEEERLALMKKDQPRQRTTVSYRPSNKNQAVEPDGKQRENLAEVANATLASLGME